MKKIIISLFMITIMLSGCGPQEVKELENLPTISFVEQNQFINIKNGSEYFQNLNKYLSEKKYNEEIKSKNEIIKQESNNEYNTEDVSEKSNKEIEEINLKIELENKIKKENNEKLTLLNEIKITNDQFINSDGQEKDIINQSIAKFLLYSENDENKVMDLYKNQQIYFKDNMVMIYDEQNKFVEGFINLNDNILYLSRTTYGVLNQKNKNYVLINNDYVKYLEKDSVIKKDKESVKDINDLLKDYSLENPMFNEPKQFIETYFVK